MAEYNACNLSIASTGIPVQTRIYIYIFKKPHRIVVAVADLQVPMSLQQSHMPVLQAPGWLPLVTTVTSCDGCCWTTGTCMNCGCWAIVSTGRRNNTHTHTRIKKKSIDQFLFYFFLLCATRRQPSAVGRWSGETGPVGRNPEQSRTAEGARLLRPPAETVTRG